MMMESTQPCMRGEGSRWMSSSKVHEAVHKREGRKNRGKITGTGAGWRTETLCSLMILTSIKLQESLLFSGRIGVTFLLR